MSSRLMSAGAVLCVAACSGSRVSSGTRPVPAAAGPLPAWRQAFEQRRATGHGIFLTDEEIAGSKAPSLVTLLQRVPSVRVICRTTGCDVRLLRAPRGVSSGIHH